MLRKLCLGLLVGSAFVGAFLAGTEDANAFFPRRARRRAMHYSNVSSGWNSTYSQPTQMDRGAPPPPSDPSAPPNSAQPIPAEAAPPTPAR